MRFEDLARADLVLDRVYSGGSAGTVADDPLQRLLPVGNQGGFRFKGSVQRNDVRLVVLYTSGAESDWPDRIDPVTGDFTYFGDNRQPGKELLDTQRGGNLLLQRTFEMARGDAQSRVLVPPFFLFERAGRRRDVVFRGLLAPGSDRLSPEEELVAVWRTTRERRFQNYMAHFTVLKVEKIEREWLDEILGGDPLGPHCPRQWRSWVRARIFEALEAPRTIRVRSRDEQYPTSAQGLALLRHIHQHFSPAPHLFEHFAAEMWLRADGNVQNVDVTRPSRDGGRDAVGMYAVGPATDPVQITFALEAKCYEPGRNSVGVKEVSRLISRIKHRDFGVLVTTSHVGDQIYREVREDQHPIVFVTGRDIIGILSLMGVRTVAELDDYLTQKFPLDGELAQAATRTAKRRKATRPDVVHTEAVDGEFLIPTASQTLA